MTRINLSSFTNLNLRSQIQRRPQTWWKLPLGLSFLLTAHTQWSLSWASFGLWSKLSRSLCKIGFSNMLKIEQTSIAMFSLGLNREATSREAEARPSNPAIRQEAYVGQARRWQSQRPRELNPPVYTASPGLWEPWAFPGSQLSTQETFPGLRTKHLYNQNGINNDFFEHLPWGPRPEWGAGAQE